MANGEQEANVRAEQAKNEAEVAQAKAKVSQAMAEAAQAEADAEHAKAVAEQAKAEAAQANAEAEQANTGAEQAKGQPDQEAKAKAADAAKTKAELAKAKEAQAKAEADAAEAKAELAKAKVEKANAEVEKAIRKTGTPPPGLPILSAKNIVILRKFTGIIFLLALGVIVIWFLYIVSLQLKEGGTLLTKLSNHEIARGFITFIIAIGTIAIAVMLVIAAFEFEAGNGDTNLKDRDESLEKRFKMGKEVLTALIGILGTIVGFYFGTGLAEKPKEPLKVAEVKVDQTKAVPGGSITLTFQVTGGKAPYHYTVTFPENTITPFEKESKDGNVKEEITIPDKIKLDTVLTPLKIKVTDSDKQVVDYEMKEPEIKVKAKGS